MIREIDQLKRQERPLPSAAGVQDSPMLPSTAQRIEDALAALTRVMGNKAHPLDVRLRAGQAHRLMHACRDPVTVRRMERRMGLSGGGAR